MREIFIAHMGLVREIDRALRQLREDGADEAELEEATKKFAPQARELAEKHAAALASHYENLAKTYKPHDEAKRKELIEQLAEDVVRRMATRPQLGPQRAGWGPPGGRRGPRGRGEGPPGGPRRRPDEGGRGGRENF